MGGGGSGQAGTTGNGGTGQGGMAGSAVAPLTIMAIGDSMTASTCWRAALWQTLDAKHAGRFDVVGAHTSDFACSPTGYDKDSEAYDNAKVSDFSAAFMTFKPDVALIQFGTDDVLKGASTNDVISGYSQIVLALRAANPAVQIFLGRPPTVLVTDRTCSGCTCAACATTLQEINDHLSSWWRAANVTLVDARNDLIDVGAETRDGVHPNDSGSAKMAARWDAALERLPQFVFPR